MGNHSKSTICVAFEDYDCSTNNRAYVMADDFTDKGTGILLHNSSVLSLDFSPMLNVMASSDAAGNVIFYIGDERRDPTVTVKNAKNMMRRIILYQSSMSADKDNLEYLRSMSDLKKTYPDLSVDFNDKCTNLWSMSDTELSAVKDRGAMSAQDLRKYPLLSVNRVNFSPNFHSRAWLFTGAQSGLGRLFYVPDLLKTK